MGYCIETDIERIIAQALSSATSQTTDELGTLSPLLNVGSVLDKNLVTTSNVNYYIQLADSEIDSILSQLYVTPFCEKCDFETALYSAIVPDPSVPDSNDYIVLERYCPLAAGDIILLTDGTNEERHEINEVIGGDTFSTVSAIQFAFPAGSRLLRVVYSAPLRFISARLAAANIYDKYFSSESSPNTSEFGNNLRGLGYDRLNDVLNGTIILHGQHRIGRRFYNSNLVDQYSLPSGGTIGKERKQMK
jgi:hypothetical protein